MLAFLESIGASFFVSLSLELWQRRGDFDDKLLAAFDRALRKSGFENKAVRKRELWKGERALERLADPSVELELRAFTEKVIPLFRREVAESSGLSQYVLLLRAEADQERLTRIQKHLDRLPTPPEYFHELRPWLRERVDSDRHPNLADFESGTYYRNADLHDTVLEKLDGARSRALILGTPGSGKTALALGIGYEFMQRGPAHTAYYVRAAHGPDASTWINEINRHSQYSGPQTLFVIDDAHSAVSKVNDLAESLYKIESTRVLIVSRSIRKEIAGEQGKSYVEVFEQSEDVVRVEVDETTIRGIVHLLANRESIGDDEIGNTKTILDKCEGDLHLLNHYVRAWEESDYSRISDVPEREVLGYVYEKYLSSRETSQVRKHLPRVAALSQFEIPVVASWLGEGQDAVQRKALVDRFSSNERFGWHSKRPFWFLEYFHATPAAYLVKAAAHERRLDGKSAEEYTTYMLKQYLESKPINFLDVFYHLHQNDRVDLQKTLYEQPDTFAWFTEWLHDTEDKQLVNASVLTGLWPFFTGVRKWDGKKAQALFQEVKGAINEQSWLEYVQQAPLPKINIIFGLQRFDSAFVLRLLLSLDFGALGVRVAEEKISPSVVAMFIREAKRAGFKAGHLQAFREGLAGAVERQAGESEASLAAVSLFIKQMAKANVGVRRIQAFCEKLDFRALGERANEDEVGLAALNNFLLDNSIEIEKHHAVALFESLDFKSLGERVEREGAGLIDVGLFSNYLLRNRIRSDHFRRFCKGLDFGVLAERTRSEEITPNAVKTLLLLTKKAGATDDLREFCNAMDLRAWSNFVHILYLADPGKIEKLVTPILRNYSADQFGTLFAESDFRSISTFLSRFNPHDPLFGWPLPQGIDFDQINFEQALTECSLLELAHFLFNFHFIGQEEWSYHFGKQLQDHTDRLRPLIEEANIGTVDFFFWNWWMALPEGGVPELLGDGALTGILARKPAKSKKARKGLLDLIGTMHLSGCAVPEPLLNRVDEQFAKHHSLAVLQEGRINSVRMLGGLWAVSEGALSDQDKTTCIQGLEEMTFELPIPNQEQALRRLRGWLAG